MIMMMMMMMMQIINAEYSSKIITELACLMFVLWLPCLVLSLVVYTLQVSYNCRKLLVRFYLMQYLLIILVSQPVRNSYRVYAHSIKIISILLFCGAQQKGRGILSDEWTGRQGGGWSSNEFVLMLPPPHDP